MGGRHQGSSLATILFAGMVVSVGGFVGGCTLDRESRLDLAENPALCPSTGYRARQPGDRRVHLAPILDARGERPLPAASGPYPTRWISDAVWTRPMVEMLDEVLRRELTASGLFGEVVDAGTPPDDAVSLRIQLLDGRSGWEEQAGYRRTVAKVAMRAVMLGPVAADGSRSEWFDETFEHETATQPRFQPPRAPVIYGGTVATVVAELLAGLDRAGLGRRR